MTSVLPGDILQAKMSSVEFVIGYVVFARLHNATLVSAKMRNLVRKMGEDVLWIVPDAINSCYKKTTREIGTQLVCMEPNLISVLRINITGEEMPWLWKQLKHRQIITLAITAFRVCVGILELRSVRDRSKKDLAPTAVFKQKKIHCLTRSSHFNLTGIHTMKLFYVTLLSVCSQLANWKK